MNWTSTLTKKQRQKNINKIKSGLLKKQELSAAEDTSISVAAKPQLLSTWCQTNDLECDACHDKEDHLCELAANLNVFKMTTEDLKKKLSAANLSLATTMEKESQLRESNNTLNLEAAQVRYDLDRLQQQLAQQLEDRDLAHADRVRLLEKTINDKEYEWARKNETLQKDLRRAIRSSIEDTEREVESLESLEQEIESLKMVIDMRSSENRELRIHNNELVTQVERLAFLETEMAKARHRLDEMTLVLQHKIDSERELLELSETLQSELVKSRAEIMQLKKNMENRQYLQDYHHTDKPAPFKVQHSNSDLVSRIQEEAQRPEHRNQHQQASSGKDKNLIMNVREKTESVAWMIQMPTSPTTSPCHQRKNFKSK